MPRIPYPEPDQMSEAVRASVGDNPPNVTRMPGVALVPDQEIHTHSMPTRGLTEFEVTVDEITPAAAVN